MTERREITAAFVREALDYDPATGILTWRERPNGPRKWNTRYAGKEAGTLNAASGYRTISFKHAAPIAAHRIAWLHFYGAWPKNALDHRNGTRDDNRIDNLREASASDNSCNKIMQRNNSSGYTGVSLDPQRGKWRARVNRNRVMHDVGFFDTPEAAASARAEYVAKIQGDFAPTGSRKRYQHHRDRKKGD